MDICDSMVKTTELTKENEMNFPERVKKFPLNKRRKLWIFYSIFDISLQD